MISLRTWCRGTPRVLAVYSFRFDAHLVPALQKNIRPLVDGSVSFDDRAATGEFSDESERRLALLTTARDAGAQWALAVDPDERFEHRLARAMPGLLEGDPGVNVYTFAFRELFAAHQYRVDGLWGRKRQARLLRLTDGIERPEGELHRPWSEFVPTLRSVATDYNMYHLKMITAERRRARADLYNRLDPDRRMQAIGYDYLADENGLVLEKIPFGRGYRPRHHEDGGLWMSSAEPS